MKRKIIKIEDEGYPDSLRNISWPPEQLYVLGNEKLLNEKCIAVVGSRNCTDNGKKVAEEFARVLSKAGLTIVSGMARGIDTSAHIGTLKTRGKTIAVLGAGFKHIFPEENKKLFTEIIKNGGAVITEYEENVDIMPKRFVERNRIVSGLSQGIFIVEAKTKSGTATTAKFARRQNKKIFCLAHGAQEKEGMGTNRLIKKGAKLVTCPEDILEEFNLAISKEKNTNSKIDVVNVPKEHLPVYKFISEKPINVDELCKKTNLNIGSVNYILTMLELEGLIRQLPGKNFIKE